MDERLNTRDCILKAAMERILHYGYAKTTMAEIAKDCDMSAGNIYRFFKAKLDIAEAMARKFNGEVYQTFAEMTRRTEEPSLKRLRDFFQHRLDRSYELLEKDAKVLEVAEVLGEERPAFANEELAQERIYLVQILEQGIKSGEIRPHDDLMFTAEMLQTALMKFRYPQLWTHLTLDKLQREFTGVFDLLDHSLRA
jgi:AcrR family transcriptional regulator